MGGKGNVKYVKCYPCWPSVSAALFLQQFYSDWEIDNYSSQLVSQSNNYHRRLCEGREGGEGREGQHFNRKLFSRRVMGGRQRRRRFYFNTHWQRQDGSGLLCFFISTEKKYFDILFVFKRCLTGESKK